MEATVVRVPIAELVFDNIREDYGDLEALGDSYGPVGPEELPTVYPNGDGHYHVLHGNRRIRAALARGATEIEVVVRPRPENLRLAQLLANTHHKDLTPIEEARALREVVDGGVSQKELAQRLSKSPSYISQALARLKWHPVLQDLVHRGTLSASAGEELGRLSLDQQALYAPKCEGKSVQYIARLVNTLLTADGIARLREGREAEGARVVEQAVEEIVQGTTPAYGYDPDTIRNIVSQGNDPAVLYDARRLVARLSESLLIAQRLARAEVYGEALRLACEAEIDEACCLATRIMRLLNGEKEEGNGTPAH